MSHPDGPAAYRVVKINVQNCFQHTPGLFCAHHGVSYVEKIPVVCTMGGSKDFAFTQSMTELSSVKVPTLTLGHPVGLQFVKIGPQTDTN